MTTIFIVVMVCLLLVGAAVAISNRANKVVGDAVDSVEARIRDR
jgi:hypothetical protein